jgi:hypothetical protein
MMTTEVEAYVPYSIPRLYHLISTIRQSREGGGELTVPEKEQ